MLCEGITIINKTTQIKNVYHLIFLIKFFLKDRVSPCSSNWPGTYYVDPASSPTPVKFLTAHTVTTLLHNSSQLYFIEVIQNNKKTFKRISNRFHSKLADNGGSEEGRAPGVRCVICIAGLLPVL